MLDLFSNTQSQNFWWVVGVFRNDGATEVIKRANDIPLHTYYPIRINSRGEPVPLFKNYLFIQFVQPLTLQICHSTTKFLKLISSHDEEGILYPVLVPKDAIDENLNLVAQGKFNDRAYLRRFYGKGSLVRVIEGIFIDKKVRLDSDITPDMPWNKKVVIDINGYKGSIELWKLAL
jgi:hypothetical protein